MMLGMLTHYVCVLQVPNWVNLEQPDPSPDQSPAWSSDRDRGRADGTSQQPHSDSGELVWSLHLAASPVQLTVN